MLSVRSTNPQEEAIARKLDGLPPPHGYKLLEPVIEEDEEEIELEMGHAQVDAMFRGPDKAARDVFIERGRPIAKIPKETGG